MQEGLRLMARKDFFWNIFQDTGSVGAYLLYRQVSQPEESGLIQESKGRENEFKKSRSNSFT